MAQAIRGALITFITQVGETTKLDKVFDYSLNCPTITPVWTYDITFKPETNKGVSISPEEILLRPFVLDCPAGKFIGICDSLDINTNDSSGVLWNITARDFRSVIIDAMADPLINFPKDMLLKDAINKLLSSIGILIDQAAYNRVKENLLGFSYSRQAPSLDGIKIEQQRPQPNTGIGEAVDSLLKKYGFLLAPGDTADKVSLITPNYEGTPTYLFKLGKSANANIVSGKVSRNWEDVPTYCELYGRSGQSALKYGKNKSIKDPLTDFIEVSKERNGPGAYNELEAIFGGTLRTKQTVKPVVAGDYFVYKPMFISIKDAKNQIQLDYMAQRAVADRLKNTLVCTYTVFGHMNEGFKIVPNELAKVEDEKGFVNEVMWIESVTYSYSNRGPTTTVKLYRPGSFVLEGKIPKK